MKTIPQTVSESTKKRNPHLYAPQQEVSMYFHGHPVKVELPPKRIRQSAKPLLNRTEQRYCDRLEGCGVKVFKQAITLRLDPPYKSYKPDLAFVSDVFGLVFVEIKGPHRFRRAGIAKAALAAKTYPQFRFELADWVNGEWKESVLSS